MFIEKIIGREQDLQKLAEFAASGRPEFVAVYGRRRVGKTFLVRSAFKDKFVFYATGIIEGTYEDELEAFNTGLERYGWMGEKAVNWMDAFKKLAELLKNLIHSHAGLHKRLTHDIHLHPFDLATTEKYIRSRKGRWDRLSILQMYSSIGGIPYYLSLLDLNLSVAENVDLMFFSDNAKLKEEYRALYRSMYKEPEDYMAIIEVLATKQEGMTRTELIEALNVADNGHFGDKLEDLVSCDFLRLYNNGTRQNGGIYQLMDFYTMFYHRFGKRRTTDEHLWRNMLNDSKQNTFYGLAFEKVGMFHFRQITRALGVSGIHTEFYSWRSKESDPRVQIDMVIDRKDGIVNICEMKYSRMPYVMTAKEADKIRLREETFVMENQDKQWTQVVVIAAKGLMQNAHSDVAVKVLTLDDLFGE